MAEIKTINCHLPANVQNKMAEVQNKKGLSTQKHGEKMSP
jgi:hypothetical protein